MTVTATLSTSNENTNKRERGGRGDRDRETDRDRHTATEKETDRQTETDTWTSRPSHGSRRKLFGWNFAENDNNAVILLLQWHKSVADNLLLIKQPGFSMARLHKGQMRK